MRAGKHTYNEVRLRKPAVAQALTLSQLRAQAMQRGVVLEVRADGLVLRDAERTVRAGSLAEAAEMLTARQ